MTSVPLPAALSLDPRDRREIERVLARVFRRNGVLNVRLFGSRARGDSRRTSDIDIALGTETTAPLSDLADLREALEESQVPFRVDLVDYASAAPALRAAIDREGIAWPM
jgi:predicted nucleotidyltransferase